MEIALIECGVAAFDQVKQGIETIEFLPDLTTRCRPDCWRAAR
jgi:hypothetical protein